jgi:hypothetical protein
MTADRSVVLSELAWHAAAAGMAASYQVDRQGFAAVAPLTESGEDRGCLRSVEQRASAGIERKLAARR